MESPQKQQDPFLFVLLGFDTLYSINLNHLLNEEEDLRVVFSHKTHKQSGSGKPYPLGMGLFVHNSKLHFYGGENINHVDPSDYFDGFEKINFEITKQQELEEDDPSLVFLNWDEDEQLINKKVFSFTPIFKFDQPPALSLVRNDSGTPLKCDFPSYLSYNIRPAIVFTVSDKVYALSTRPFDGSLMYPLTKEEQDLFHVFEPNSNGKGQWSKLPNPPLYLGKGLTQAFPPIPIYHCVFKNQLFLQTPAGEFIFDLIDKQWFEIPYEEYPTILASLEYKGQLLLFYEFGYLAAYDLKSFEKYKGGYFWRSSSSFASLLQETIFPVCNNTVDDCAFAASLSIVDDNSICLVFKSYKLLHVCHFKFIEPLGKFELKAYRKFYLPPVMNDEPYTLSSFVIKKGDDVGKSNQDSATGSIEGKSHLKRKIQCEDEMEGTCLMEEY